MVQVPDHESSRNWGQANLLNFKKVVLCAVAVLSTIVIFSDLALSIAMLWAALTLLLTIIIKGAGFFVHITGQSHPSVHTLKNVSARLPCVSVMISLFHEPKIADALIKRLENITYPKPLLDIVLVLEAVDEITHTAIQRIQLPSWIKVVVVPDAKGLTTKPRTMNYALEKLGRWDAYNVTEDADLGVRFASHGDVTELIPTVTYEEVNCQPWRWLKGFMITYIVHLKDPAQFLRELGSKHFMGLQMTFLATFPQFLFAPVLWFFWITIFGYHHPIQNMLGDSTIQALLLLFFFSEILNMTMGMTAITSPNRRHLLKWVVTMPLHFTLGPLVSYKALYELIVTPFYWDKTEHGVSNQT